jgi:hypothetical protein
MIEEKKLEMSLLYNQSIEIIILYHQEIKKNILNILKYYIVPKKWLDNYKLKNNYDSIKEEIPFSDNINQNKINNDLNEELNSLESLKEKEFIEKYKIFYPKNFTLVKKEIFNSLKEINLYEVIFGEKNIFIFDNNIENKNKNIFICSLNYENDYREDITNFFINVDSIIIIEENRKDKEMEKLFNFISEKKGIKNYYKERNINVSNIGKQIIYDNEEEKIGIFYQLLNGGNLNKIQENDLMEYLNNNNNSNNKKSITRIGINAICNNLKEEKKKEEKKKKNKSKCITIYGDIYYYLKKNEIKNDNFSISEYKNNEL